MKRFLIRIPILQFGKLFGPNIAASFDGKPNHFGRIIFVIKLNEIIIAPISIGPAAKRIRIVQNVHFFAFQNGMIEKFRITFACSPIFLRFLSNQNSLSFQGIEKLLHFLLGCDHSLTLSWSNIAARNIFNPQLADQTKNAKTTKHPIQKWIKDTKWYANNMRSKRMVRYVGRFEKKNKIKSVIEICALT